MAELLKFNRKVVLRRPAKLSLGALAVLIAFAAAEAKAGVIIPWQQSQASADLDLAFETGDASRASDTTSVETERETGREKLQKTKLVETLKGQAGGASVPAQNAGGSSNAAPAAVFDMRIVVRVARSIAYFRERTPQLPQLPPGELLDPPKSC